VLVLATFLLQETLLPTISRRHMEMWRILNRSEPDRMTRVPHFHDRGGGRLSMAVYRPFARRMEGVMITFWDVNGEPREHLWYPELAWDGARHVWTAPSGGERIPANARDPGSQRFPVEAGAVAPIVASAALLEIAFTATRSPGLSLAQAAALADANPDNPGFTLLVHQLFTTPLSILVLLLVALAFSVRIGSRTKSALPGMMGALAVAGLFFGLQFLVASLARAGDLNPVVLAWLPNVLFGSLGLALYLTLDG
jgi:lipopolysaccharide export LptBFGC system permease protein LptF